ncbi:MAG: NosD domain-containing protein, partial [Candidatus Hydrogenedentota bacterium]
MTIRRNIFHDLPTSRGSRNQSAIMFVNSHGRLGEHIAIQDNVFRDINGYAVISYTTRKVLFENNLIEDCDSRSPGIGPKMDNQMWFIRANTARRIKNQRVVWLYNAGARTADQEVSYNLVDTPDAGAAFIANQSASKVTGKAYVFRNTFAGPAVFVRVLPTQGPFYVYDNVFVREEGKPALTFRNKCDLSRTVEFDNLVVRPDQVDDRLRLKGDVARYAGTRGYESRKTSPPSPKPARDKGKQSAR